MIIDSLYDFFYLIAFLIWPVFFLPFFLFIHNWCQIHSEGCQSSLSLHNAEDKLNVWFYWQMNNFVLFNAELTQIRIELYSRCMLPITHRPFTFFSIWQMTAIDQFMLQHIGYVEFFKGIIIANVRYIFSFKIEVHWLFVFKTHVNLIWIFKNITLEFSNKLDIFIMAFVETCTKAVKARKTLKWSIVNSLVLYFT